MSLIGTFVGEGTGVAFESEGVALAEGAARRVAGVPVDRHLRAQQGDALLDIPGARTRTRELLLGCLVDIGAVARMQRDPMGVTISVKP